MKRVVSGIMLTLLLASMLATVAYVRQVKATGTIYIRADGSIDPVSAPISTSDNVNYLLFADIYDSIVIERNSIVLDGAGHRVQGAGGGYGVDLTDTNATTVKNLEIENFGWGIMCDEVGNSHDNIIVENDVKNNGDGIVLYGPAANYLIVNNRITGSFLQDGIWILKCTNIQIIGNEISMNKRYGICIASYSTNNLVIENNITGNHHAGVGFGSSPNTVFHNNFENNTMHATGPAYPNVLDDGYPSGGNYWSDYNETDLFSGSYQNETGSDNIGDSPYVIDANNVDNYPLMRPYVPFEKQTIYIRADGSIDPSGAPIQRAGGIYTLTDNITSDSSGIVIERNNMTLDGMHYRLTGNNAAYGIHFRGRYNVTILNAEVSCFSKGIYVMESSNANLTRNRVVENIEKGILFSSSSASECLDNFVSNNLEGIYLSGSSANSVLNNTVTNSSGVAVCLGASSHNILVGNNISRNLHWGVYLYSSSDNNVISHNEISENQGYIGIGLGTSFSDSPMSNLLFANNITKTEGIAIYFDDGVNNTVLQNNIEDNEVAFEIHSGSLGNRIRHNNFLNNTKQVILWGSPENNSWDDGYPSGGNYWSDNNNSDMFSGYYQNETGIDGIMDTPYLIDTSNTDNFPLVHPYGSIQNLNTSLVYLTIQSAINSPETLEGHTVLVRNGTYYENVIVDKSVSLIGENKETTVIDGNGTGNIIHIISDNVTVIRFRAQNSGQVWPLSNGIYVDHANNTRIENVTVQNCRWGISAYEAGNCLLVSNTVETSSQWGIWLWRCSDSSANNNIAINNIVGIKFEESSNCTIYHNLAVNNTNSGLQLWTINNCSIISNTAIDNQNGIYLIYAEDNVLYHNNFVNNEANVYWDLSYGNVWDNGFEGNNWNDYTGLDLYHGSYQNESGSDGIGDTPYVINADNADHYPLVKPYPWGPNDVGVTYIGRVKYPDMVAFRTFIWRGLTLRFDTFIMNYGNSSENLNVTAYANGTVIDQRSDITLEEHNSTILTLEWNSSGFDIGFYNITVYAEPVQGETDTTDNARSVWMFVYIVGDLNGDGKVDIKDISTVAKAFGQTVPPISPNLDVNEDWKIDIRDISIVARHFGDHYP